jgi:1L-myo-inositol 1-phosphate cytidylyltransferase
MKVVIIAAGMGSRLWGSTNKIPKTLLPFGNGTILSMIIENFKTIGFNKFVIVVGFKSEYITEYVVQQERFGVSVEFIENPEWKRGNGLSVTAARAAVRDESFILSMSDHIVSIEALQKISEHKSQKNLLLVDPRIDEIFDIDDATKVQVENGRITSIGKEMKFYNAVDCGIFRLTKRFFSAMDKQVHAGKDSISAGIQKLIETDDMQAVLMKSHHRWIDLDTPESYIYARRYYDKIV